jgi:hypothetical protein
MHKFNNTYPEQILPQGPIALSLCPFHEPFPFSTTVYMKDHQPVTNTQLSHLIFHYMKDRCTFYVKLNQ